MDKYANPVRDNKIQPFSFCITEVTLTQYQEFGGNCSFLNSKDSWNLPFPHLLICHLFWEKFHQFWWDYLQNWVLL